MKKVALASAALAALLASASMAQAQTIGQIGVSYADHDLEVLDLAGEGDSIQVEGSVAFDGGPVRFGLDASLNHFNTDAGDADVVSATGHVRGLTNALGAFVGVSNNEDATLWGLGIDGKASNEFGSLYLQFGYGKADDLDDVDFWAGRVEGRLFVNDNFFIGLNAGLTKAEDLNITNFGVEAEYQFPNTPMSLFAAYEHGEINDIDLGIEDLDRFDLETETLRVGVRLTFGGSLRDRDRAGVGQGSVDKLFGATLGTAIIGAVGEIIDDFENSQVID